MFIFHFHSFLFSLWDLFFEGLPKPAIINQSKGIRQTHGYRAIDFSHQDVTYVVTPLYHSAATCVGVFNTIGEGKLYTISIYPFLIYGYYLCDFFLKRCYHRFEPEVFSESLLGGRPEVQSDRHSVHRGTLSLLIACTEGNYYYKIMYNS